MFDFYDAAHALPERYDADLCCSDDRQFSGSRTRVTRALVQQRIIQVSQDRSRLVIRGDLVFLQQRSVVRVLGTNGKGMAGTLRRIEEESAGFDGTEGRHWSQRGLARLARKAWVKAVADVAEDCFAVQRKVLESHEARVRTAIQRARSKAKACAVTQQKPTAADRNPIELEAHHLFNAASRPDLAALDDNLLVISSALLRNYHKLKWPPPWEAMNPQIDQPDCGQRRCEPPPDERRRAATGASGCPGSPRRFRR